MRVVLLLMLAWAMPVGAGWSCASCSGPPATGCHATHGDALASVLVTEWGVESLAGYEVLRADDVSGAVLMANPYGGVQFVYLDACSVVDTAPSETVGDYSGDPATWEWLTGPAQSSVTPADPAVLAQWWEYGIVMVVGMYLTAYLIGSVIGLVDRAN